MNVVGSMARRMRDAAVDLARTAEAGDLQDQVIYFLLNYTKYVSQSIDLC